MPKVKTSRASIAAYPTNVEWQVPLRGESGEWYPIIRVGRHVPFGYKQDEEDIDLLLPIPEELELLEKAKLFLQEYSLRQVAKWLTQQSGRYISHVGLDKRVRIGRRKSKKKDLVVELPKESLETTGQTETISSQAENDLEQPKREIIFEPNPGPQTNFLAATEQEVLYGGAAGGGKSYSLIADPVRYLNNPNARMLIVRRSTEELRELISVSKQLYPRAIPGIKFMERDKTWVAPSGATLWMSYLDRDDDVMSCVQQKLVDSLST